MTRMLIVSTLFAMAPAISIAADAPATKAPAKAEDSCNAELAKACSGIAYGKYCGMKHLD